MFIVSWLFLLLSVTTASLAAPGTPHPLPAPPAADLLDITCPSASRCLAVGEAGTILESTDGGRRWNLLAAPTDRDLLAVACADGDRCIAAGAEGMVFRSVDAGTSWTLVESGTSAMLNAAACVDEHCVLVGSGATLLYSDDAGLNWTPRPLASDASLFDLDCSSTGRCLAVGSHGTILLSENGGLDWQLHHRAENLSLHAVACSGMHCLALTWRSGELYRSVDGGRRWAPQSTPFSDSPLALDCLDGGRCWVLVSGGNVYASTLEIWRSRDGGDNWQSREPGIGATPLALTCLDGGNCVAVGEQAAALFAPLTGAGDWSFAAVRGLPAFLDLSCPGVDTCYGLNAGAFEGNPLIGTARFLASDDGGRNWRTLLALADDDTRFHQLACPSETFCAIRASRWNGNDTEALLLTTDDGGLSWETTVLPGDGDYSPRYGLAMHCPEPGYCYVRTARQLWRVDAGGLQPVTLPPGDSTRYLLCPNATDCLISMDGLWYATNDAGANWSAQYSLSVNAWQPSASLCPGPDHCLVWWRYRELRVFSRQEDGQWRAGNAMLDGVRDLDCAGNDCLASADGAWYLSDDGGRHWRPHEGDPGAAGNAHVVACRDSQRCFLQASEDLRWYTTYPDRPLQHTLRLLPPGPLPATNQPLALGFAPRASLGEPHGTVTVATDNAQCQAPADHHACLLPLRGALRATATLTPDQGAPVQAPPLTLTPRAAPFPNPAIRVSTTTMTVDGDCARLGEADLAGGDGAVSLIEALCLAANRPGPDTVVLQANARYRLVEAQNYWYGPNGLPAVFEDLRIQGNGAVLARAAAAPPFRFFYVGAHPASELPRGSLTLVNLTLAGGLARGGAGAEHAGGGAGLGGAIFNHGSLRLEGVRLRANEARGGDGGASFYYVDDAAGGGGGGGLGGNGDGPRGGGFRPDGAPFARGVGGTPGAGLNTGGGGAGFAPWAAGGGGLAATAAYGGGSGVAGGPGGGASGLFWNYRFTVEDPRSGGHFGEGASYGGGGGVGGGGGGGRHGEYLTQDGGDGGFGGGGGAFAGHGGFGGGDGNTYDGAGAGAGLGGAIFNHHGHVVLLNSELAGNMAGGGRGGDSRPQALLSLGGRGGDAGGGGLYNRRGVVELLNTRLLDNRGEPGRGGEGFDEDGRTYPLGPAGEALGDDCVADGGTLEQSDSLVGASPGAGCDDPYIATRTTLLATTPANPLVGRAITVDFAVSADTPVVGRVTILLDDTAVCQARISAGQCEFIPTAPGTFFLRVRFAGGGSFLASESAVQSLTVADGVLLNDGFEDR